MNIPVCCKLCGGNVCLECWESHDLQIEQWGGYIDCGKCGTSLPRTRGYSPTREESKRVAIEHWNALHGE